MCDIKVEERGENKQKQEEAREEGYLYLMLISDDGRVIFTTQEDSSVILYIIYGMQFEIADQYSEICHICSHTCVIDALSILIPYIDSICPG